jgi:SAM-dependent methyltransferase
VVVSEPAVADAATRFYVRSHQQLAAEEGEADDAAFLASMQSGTGRYSRVYRHLTHNPGLDVLELGCGSAVVARALGPLARGYTMIDIVAARLGQDWPANVTAIRANLDDDFPVPSAGFDVVNAMMVVEHLYDPFHSFTEIARVLRPGGVAFVNLPNIASLRCRIALLLGKLPNTSAADWFERREWDGNHLHYFTVASVRRIAALVGLELTALAPVGRGAAIKRLRPQLLCHEITFELRKVGKTAQHAYRAGHD